MKEYKEKVITNYILKNRQDYLMIFNHLDPIGFTKKSFKDRLYFKNKEDVEKYLNYCKLKWIDTSQCKIITIKEGLDISLLNDII